MTIPTKLNLSVCWFTLKGVGQQIGEKNLGLVSAGVAFFGMLAMFPGLAAVIAIWGLVADPVVIDTQMDLMKGIVPEDVFALIDAQMTALLTARPETLGFASLASIMLALWSARAGVGAMMMGLNAIQGVPNRGGLRHYFTAMTLTISLVGVALIAAISVVIAPIVLAFLPLGYWQEMTFQLLRWAAAIFVLLIGLGVLYRYGPNSRPRMAWITPGAILSVVLWAAASFGFSIYLTNFGNYNEVYGSIGAAIALLMWLYISAYLILLGAALNAQITPTKARLPRSERKKLREQASSLP